MFSASMHRLFISIVIVYNIFAPIHPMQSTAVETYWDWKTIESDPRVYQMLSFDNKQLQQQGKQLAQLIDPSKKQQYKKQDTQFLWGAAISHWQNGLQDKSNWATWQEGDGNIKHAHTNKNSCDSWNCYQEDIQALDHLGLNAFRFSVEWSIIQPEQNVWNEQAISHYHDAIDALRRAGKTPMITLHHFVHPQWFEELGAFEKEENITYFVNFCKKVFDEFSDKVTFWCTINEPSVYAFQGYIGGFFPPGQILNLKLAGIVLRNLLKAHVRVYHELKQQPGGKQVKIGIVHQHLLFNPYHQNILGATELMVTNFLSLPSVATFNFLKTGKFKFDVNMLMNTGLGIVSVFKNKNYQALCAHLCPSSLSIEYDDSDAPKSFDFIGLNYYSQVLLSLLQDKPAHREGDILTDFWYAFYPEGFHQAIVEVAQLGVPIYITENGIAADGDKDDYRREKWIQRYLYALSRAMSEGCDVRGYFYWTLMDNFEWNEGYIPKFGLYEVAWTEDKKRILTLKKGARALADIIRNQAFKNALTNSI